MENKYITCNQCPLKSCSGYIYITKNEQKYANEQKMSKINDQKYY